MPLSRAGLAAQAKTAKSAVRFRETLSRLFDVALAMDADKQSERPTETQYRNAMRAAARALGRSRPTWPKDAS